ncbi:hypothetical protein ACFSCX_13420 [Bacillus salitolerans]|uniref:ABM domain-containing protein n=1 Tax=Bacillus salitolerans TaxID=1437434 RepID=A0ABW4LQU4_9BACI
MTVYVYQTFEIKQENFSEALQNIKDIQKFRNEHYDQKVEILAPVSGDDFKYVLFSTFEGLAEMELQNKKMYEDEEFTKLISEFVMENIVQGSLSTQIFRSMPLLKLEE